jgi:sortase B
MIRSVIITSFRQKNENEWNAFTESVGAMVVNGGMSVKAGDELLTLSTCNSYIEDGRLFLLAKRVTE